MRRLGVVVPLFLLALVACKRVESSLFTLEAPAPKRVPQRYANRDPKTGRIVTPKCSSDGSWEKARDCFRRTDVVRFQMPDGMGTVKREDGRSERMVLFLGRGQWRGKWAALRTARETIWTLNQVRVTKVPPQVERTFRWVTLNPEPRTAPKMTRRDENAVTYEFGQPGAEDHTVIRIDAGTGRIAEITTAGMTLRFG